MNVLLYHGTPTVIHAYSSESSLVAQCKLCCSATQLCIKTNGPYDMWAMGNNNTIEAGMCEYGQTLACIVQVHVYFFALLNRPPSLPPHPAHPDLVLCVGGEVHEQEPEGALRRVIGPAAAGRLRSERPEAAAGALYPPVHLVAEPVPGGERRQPADLDLLGRERPSRDVARLRRRWRERERGREDRGQTGSPETAGVAGVGT